MENVQEIKEAVSLLSRPALEQFRSWFEEFDAALWDRQFESDAQAGKLDKIAKEALTEYHAGRYKKL